MPPILTPLDAAILGVVEGVTEFLPVSSTGHLILASHWLGLDAAGAAAAKAGVDAFEIVIQSGALLAVVGLYRRRVASMAAGLLGRDPAGRRLLARIAAAFLPAVLVGLLAAGWIKENLFGVWPVVAALAAGGLLMIGVERRRTRRAGGRAAASLAGRPVEQMTLGAAIAIGFAQCLAMWPGTSRSMATIVAALLLGFSPRAAAEFSFLLALPTLGAAAAHDLLQEGGAILGVAGGAGLAVGFAVSCAVALAAVKGFLAYLTHHGMAVFGWYRIALAAVVALALGV